MECKFLNIDDKLYENDKLNNIYKENNSIYLIHYPGGFKSKISYGTINGIDENNYNIT